MVITIYYPAAKAILFINLVGQSLSLICDNQEIDCITECDEVAIASWLAEKTFIFKINRRPLSFEVLFKIKLNDVSSEAICIIDNAARILSLQPI